MILTNNQQFSKKDSDKKELYANKEDLEFFIEKCCKYYEYIFGSDIRYMISEGSVTTRTRMSVSSPDPLNCVYNLHIEFKDNNHHISYNIRFKEVSGTNVPMLYDIYAYYFENKTIKHLPIESYCPEIQIHVDSDVDITHYSLDYRYITNEYDDNGDYSEFSNILDFEFIVYPDSIDVEIVVNYHLKGGDGYDLLEIKNLTENDLLKLDYFLRLMEVSDSESFSYIFEYTPTILKTSAEIRTIFNSVMFNFDKVSLDQNFLLYSMAKI
jgi:hypothetical protein